MIFTEFQEGDVISGRINQVSSGLFSDTADSLKYNQSLFIAISGSNNAVPVDPFDIKNTQYYVNVYSAKADTITPNEFYFSIAYGDYDNSGSSIYNIEQNIGLANVLNKETKAIYSQYKNILLQPGDNLFSFASGSINSYESIDSKGIFVLNFATDKIKDKIDPGQFQLNFAIKQSNGSGSYLDFSTTSNTLNTLSLIDDSYIVNKKQNVYNLIQGRIKNNIPVAKDNNPEYESIGLLYPNDGIVILNALKLNELLHIIDTSSVSGSILDYRATYKNKIDAMIANPSTESFQPVYFNWSVNLFNSMKAVNPDVVSNEVTGSFPDDETCHMCVRKSEFVPSTTYFVRVKNREYNYTNNPTFISDGTDGKTKGTIIHQELIDNPRTYITTVGLYNSNNELLAVGKLSRPWVKSFDNELLLKVRLDF